MVEAAGARARPRPGAGPQPVHVGRPVHARPDERRQVLRAAVRARRAARRRRGRRGRGRRGSGLSPRRHCPARPRLARVRACSTPRSAPGGRSRRSRRSARTSACWACRADRVRRAAGGRRDAARRHRLRLRRRRRGGQPGRPDRQAQGRGAGDRQRRLAGEGRAPARRSASTPPSTTTTARSASRCAAAAPDGIDVYFDNVGGDHLEAAISALRLHGRAAICGMISQYNADRAAGRAAQPGAGDRQAADPARLPGQRPRTTCGSSSCARSPAGCATASCRYDETIVDGIENAPEAFLGLLRGENLGKMLVRL